AITQAFGLMAVTAMANYTNPQLYLVSVLIVGLAFAAVNVPSVSTWEGFGSALREWLSDPVRLKWVNIRMATLLVLSL
ncbi:LysE family translocator, partial [Rhizobium ruizarguesonis]